MIIETSWDDGTLQDLRIAELLKKYKLPGTFYIPVFRGRDDDKNMGLTDQQVRELAVDFEIGAHTVSHPLLTRIPYHQAEKEIYLSKKMMEGIIRKPITKFCYPRGYYNDKIKEFVKNAGFAEARTTKILNVSIPKDKLEVETTIHVYQRDAYMKKDWLDVALELLKNKPEYFHLWGHSWEIDKFNNWAKLEKLLEGLSENICAV